MALNLYSEVEELFLDREAAFQLWSEFIKILKKYNLKSVLDIGCGGGDFCVWAQKEGFEVKGIDLSEAQVERALSKGCNAEKIDVCDIKEHFDGATAIFDVVNYLDKKELKRFFNCVEKVADYFIFDMNTYYAMEDLAVGTLKTETDTKFATLFSEFENNKLITEITLFEKRGDCYTKKQDKIIQYYHSVEDILNATNMELIEKIDISLYGSEEAEKEILVLKKRN